MKIEFQGVERTKKGILERLMASSDSIDSLKNKLASLKIFSSIESSKNKIKVVEDKNRINVSSNSISGTTKNSLNLIFPNLLGRAISSRISLSSFSDYEVKLSKPVFSKNLFFVNFFNTNSLLNLPCGTFPINKSEVEIKLNDLQIGVGLDKIQGEIKKYARINYLTPTLGVSVKQDLTPFTKIEVDHNLSFPFLNFFRVSMRLGVGTILGNPPVHERFFLGKNIKGYKDKAISPTDFNIKNGGLSYFELTNKLLVRISKVNFYVFNSLGYNSRQENLVNTAKEAYKEIRNMNNSAFGLSVGVGASIPLTKDTGTLLDATLSFPLTNNKNIERYQFDLNFDF